MPAIAELYATVMPETSRIAEGLVRAFREVDPKAAEAGRRWGREIEKGIGDVKVEVKADTAKAKAEIDEAAHDRNSTIHVDVDKDRLGSSMSQATSRMGAAAASEGGDIGAKLGNSIMSAMQPILLTGAVGALGGIASSLSGLAGLAPAGLAGAGSLVATLAVGLHGVKDAWDAAGKAADSSGKDQAAHTKAVADAQKSLKDAVIDESMAQKDVANARRDARQQLEDLNIQMRGGVIDEKQAILDAQAARRDLATGRFRDAIEYEQAQLRVEQADQRVLESHARNVELQSRAAEANTQGVEGSDRVVAANQRLEKAHDSVAAAQRNLAEAQAKTSSAEDAAALSMSKLSPVAQALVGTLVGLKPLWEGFQKSVQDSLLNNMGPQIQQLATAYMPMLQSSFTTMAGFINQAATAFMGFLEQPATMSMVQQLLNNINTSFREFLPTIQTLGQAFLQMMATGSSFLPQLGQIIGQLAQMFAGFVNSGQFSQWMQTGLGALQLLTNMLPTVLQMFNDLAPIGTAALGGIGQILTAIQPAIAPLSNLFSAFITNSLTPILSLLAQIASTVLSALAPAMQQWFETMGPVANTLIQAIQPVLQTLGPVLANTAQALMDALIPAVQQLIPSLIPVVEQVVGFYQAMLPLLPTLMQVATVAMPIFVDVLKVVLPIIGSVFAVLKDLAEIVIPALSTALTKMVDLFKGGWDTVRGAVETAWKAIEKVLKPFEEFLDKLLGGLDKIKAFLPHASTAAASAAPGTLTGPPLLSGVPHAAAGGASPSGFDWDAVLPHEGGTWDNADTGHNGHFGGLQFSPSTWAAYGGLEFADRPDHATPLQQKIIADRTAFTGWKGTPPQGLGAWEAITKGLVPGITTSSRPPGGVPSPSVTQGNSSFVVVPPTAAAAPTAVLPTPAAGAAGGLPDVRGAHPQFASALSMFQQMFPGLKLNAGKDDHGVDQGWHPRGQAIDIGGPDDQMAALSNWLLQFAPNIEELIHSGPGVTQNIKSGKIGPAIDMPGSVYNSQQAGYHGDHIHLAVTDQMAQAFIAAISGGGTGAYPSAAMPTIASPNGLGATPQSPMYVSPAGNSGGQQLGQDIFDGFLEIFGIDGSVFKNPFGTPVFQGLKGIMSLLTGGGKGKGGSGLPASAWAAAGGDGASLPALGSGGDLLGGILRGVVPEPFGDLNIGGPKQAPDEYQPMLPGSGGKSVLPAGYTPGKPADNRTSDQSGYSPTFVLNGEPPKGATGWVHEVNVPAMRQGVRALPGGVSP